MDDKDRIRNNFPIFVVRVNRSDSIACKSKMYEYWNEWSGHFYKHTAQLVEEHMKRCFPAKTNKEITFAIFIKKDADTYWEFVKKIR